MHRTIAIATVRADGWPQNTFVSYANEALILYFLISRSSQKLHNIARDKRVALAIGREQDDLHGLTPFYAAAEAFEVHSSQEREHAWHLLSTRHPSLASYELPNQSSAAFVRAICRHISVLDFSKGLGHTDNLTVGVDQIVTMDPAHIDNWGFVNLELRQ